LKSNSYIHQSKKLLFTTFNCAKSQLIPLQAMNGIEDDELVMSLTGLAGGVLNNGSTCGVVIGSAVGIAMLRDRELAGQWTLEDEIQLLQEVREQVNWFESRFNTSLCREREELNYERITVLGLLNPQKAKGCVARAGASMERFTGRRDSVERGESPAGEGTVFPSPDPGGGVRGGGSEHCAAKILAEIRAQTGIGSERLERISVALDGGIGLAGGGCGALSGALMALGLRYALDTKNTEPDKLKNIYRAFDAEFFRKAILLANGFLKEFGALECSRLTDRKFKDWDEFSEFRNSAACDRLNKFVTEKTMEIIGFE
jgi:hypothetical protein